MTPQDSANKCREICELAPVIPVLVVNDVAVSSSLAKALIAGGLPALEVTLRTPAALQVITEMANVAGSIVGAGTLITPQDAKNAKDAGAVFGVSPGATDALLSACLQLELPLLAGAATATEAMQLLAKGYTVQKYFPAEANGGAGALKSLAGPLPQISFCPTGGITKDNAVDYLALDNTLCVGGSWVAPAKLVEQSDWSAIEKLARDAAQLG